LPNDELLHLFLKEAESQGLKYLQGHKLVGGARASLYNAMPLEGVLKLISFMEEYSKKS
jgi:phosphoserine aminotransferase